MRSTFIGLALLASVVTLALTMHAQRERTAGKSLTMHGAIPDGWKMRSDGPRRLIFEQSDIDRDGKPAPYVTADLCDGEFRGAVQVALDKMRGEFGEPTRHVVGGGTDAEQVFLERAVKEPQGRTTIVYALIRRPDTSSYIYIEAALPEPNGYDERLQNDFHEIARTLVIEPS